MEPRSHNSNGSNLRRGPDTDRAMACAVLVWYDENGRELPWRAKPGQRADPYCVWLSEIMLQQTTVATVGPYFSAFIQKWPTVADLARASLDDVLHAWQGLGYYARARNLHNCARIVAEEHAGWFPDDEAALLKLPGIGAYTAAAIAAIAFNRHAVPVDGNIERVVSRLFMIRESGPALKTRVAEAAEPLVPDRPGDFWQAIMDLGATVCRPKGPICGACPVAKFCLAREREIPEDFPRKKKKTAKPTRYGVAFLGVGPENELVLRRRPPSGLLGGMIEVPSTEWRTSRWRLDDAVSFAPAQTVWGRLDGAIRHTFTHFHLELIVVTGGVDIGSPIDGFWCLPEELRNQALPSVMKKILRRTRHLTGPE
ncbi:MAG: A/G-specific adenine glycosylase [Rhodospirillales bacterium]|nr:A/G-specific adenine glycosylase [Rhodospirillales bacterium]